MTEEPKIKEAKPLNLQMKVTLKIKELNNTSRKGTYIYIKTPQQRASYYKYDENAPFDYYIKHYQEKNQRQEPKKGSSIKKEIKALTTILFFDFC